MSCLSNGKRGAVFAGLVLGLATSLLGNIYCHNALENLGLFNFNYLSCFRVFVYQICDVNILVVFCSLRLCLGIITVITLKKTIFPFPESLCIKYAM